MKAVYQELLQQQIDEEIIRGAVVMGGDAKTDFFYEAYGQARNGIKIATDSIFDLASITNVLSVE